MERICLTIDGRSVEARAGSTLLEAARASQIYIPTLCSHPDLPPAPGERPKATEVYRGGERLTSGQSAALFEGCGLCLVEIDGKPEPIRACEILISEGLDVRTDTEALRQARQENLKVILADHPHACILCPLREGCDRRTCSMDVPPEERCCEVFNHCEIRFVSEYVGILPDTPRFIHPGRPVLRDEPLFTFDWNLCIGCTRCVRVCRDVRGIEALEFIVDEGGRVVVGTKGPTLAESGCIFCGACVVVCPSGSIMDDEGKKAHDALGFVPCVDACPAGIDIPRYVRFIAEGKFSQALAVVRERVPFPGVLGYVCYHPCERACRRGDLNEPVSICRLKRFAFERGEDGSWKSYAKRRLDTGRRAAVVGSGPAGLTAAYYLRKRGHAVTVFEALPRPGGMLRYGIPPFRLPRRVLDSEIGEIEAVGVEIRTNSRVESLDELLASGYEAVFLAVGAHRERALGIPGEDLALSGVEFLRRVNSGESVAVGKRVAVIGGGNVATDVARTALRLGAQEVTILYRRTRSEMPAYAEEIERTLEEGVRLRELTVPVRFERVGGGLRLLCARTRLEPAEGGARPKPIVIPNSEFPIECDTVIAAIGQEPEVPAGFQVALGDGAVIQVDPETLRTDRPGVFAGGDAVSGPASIIEAIALGRRAAEAIDRFLGGEGEIEERLVYEPPHVRSEATEGFLEQPRAEAGCLELERRLLGLDRIVERGYEEKAARREAQRCLRCDLRVKLARVPLPPRREALISLTAEAVERLPEVEGVYRLYDKNREILTIKGVPNLRAGLREQLEHPDGKFFDYEEEPMYTQRESELLQQYLQKHGKLPGGEMDELDELF
jgi:NADPH-dependent glutamate synthase beta subunit-like oxidoreductase